jgi:riboflavin kinase/FMN adenylyltransferase
MEEVAELLGYPYSVSGKVLHGNQIGRTIGFPTINFEPEKEKILPPFGAYVSSVTVDGISYKAVTNVGMKPTVEGNKSLTVETHILDFAKDVYDDFLEVSLLHFIRPETKFESFEALKKQLQSDVENSLTY